MNEEEMFSFLSFLFILVCIYFTFLLCTRSKILEAVKFYLCPFWNPGIYCWNVITFQSDMCPVLFSQRHLGLLTLVNDLSFSEMLYHCTGKRLCLFTQKKSSWLEVGIIITIIMKAIKMPSHRYTSVIR